MRTKKSLTNFAVAFAGQILSLIISLGARMIFLRCLSEEYLGLSGLFSNVLAVFSLVELGIGPAISFSLYKPLAQGDTEKIKSLMRLYRNVYRAVAAVLLVLGLLFTRYYRLLMLSVPDIPNLDVIYGLFVVNAVCSYFFAYKRALIICDQNRYISSLYKYVFYILVSAGQAALLLWTHNYLLYLGLQIAGTLLENIAVSARANRLYPYLRESRVRPLDQKTGGEIKKTVGAMVFHKVGTLVVQSTDNILISKMIGLAAAGLYANYQLITMAVNVFTSNLFDSLVASVGNLNAGKERGQMSQVFWRVFFMDAWVYGFCSICLAALLQPFITLFFGERYLLSPLTVVAIVLSFYLAGMRMAALSFREATGIYYYDRYKPIFESVINLVASVWLAKRIGMAGIFFGTAVSAVTTCVWVEPLMLFRHGFSEKLSRYFARYGLYTAVTLAVGGLTVFLAGRLPEGGILFFALRLLLCLVLPNLLFMLAYRARPEYGYFKELIARLAGGFFARVKRGNDAPPRA